MAYGRGLPSSDMDMYNGLLCSRFAASMVAECDSYDTPEAECRYHQAFSLLRKPLVMIVLDSSQLVYTISYKKL